MPNAGFLTANAPAVKRARGASCWESRTSFCSNAGPRNTRHYRTEFIPSHAAYTAHSSWLTRAGFPLPSPSCPYYLNLLFFELCSRDTENSRGSEDPATSRFTKAVLSPLAGRLLDLGGARCGSLGSLQHGHGFLGAPGAGHSGQAAPSCTGPAAGTGWARSALTAACSPERGRARTAKLPPGLQGTRLRAKHPPHKAARPSSGQSFHREPYGHFSKPQQCPQQQSVSLFPEPRITS